MPHGVAARLLTGIVSTSRDGSRRRRDPRRLPARDAGAAPCFLGLELGAQAAAALDALMRAADGGPAMRVGYLVRVREASFLAPQLPIDTPLRVTARLEGAAPPLAVHRICVSVGGVDYLRAVISTQSGLR